MNDAFIPAFQEMGLPESDCRITECDCDDRGFEVPALTVWQVEGNTKGERAKGLAEGVRATLGKTSAWPVRHGGELRPVRAGDIAILCRTGTDVNRIASEIAALGVRVAVERDGLFACPEIELVVSALKWTADGSDRLALTELARLCGPQTEPDLWLRAAAEEDPATALRALVPFATTLERFRARQLELTPSEILDGIIVEGDLMRWSCGWGKPASRIENLETLRGLARNYEEICRRSRAAATLGGLTLWLDEQNARQPKSLDPDAVQVMTYHKAKGLEWPIVVLTQLEDEIKCDLFKSCVELGGELDWRSPLAGRWIRYWPWPYGAQEKGVYLDTAGPNSDVGRRVLNSAREEAVRLLYVGATRARDHLVFVHPSGAGPSWLDQLRPNGTASHITFPKEGEEPFIRVQDRGHPTRLQTFHAADHASVSFVEPVYVGLDREQRQFRPLRLRPSAAIAESAVDYRILGRVDLGGRVPITGKPEMDQVGEALHSILAADDPKKTRESREAKANAILQRWSISAIDPKEAIICADRLWAFLGNRFPGAKTRREVPVYAVVNTQVITGRIDLLIEGEDWFALLDHKSFPGAPDKWDAKAISYAPQLDLYTSALVAATKKACCGHFIHMPLVGVVNQVGTSSLSTINRSGRN